MPRSSPCLIEMTYNPQSKLLKGLNQFFYKIMQGKILYDMTAPPDLRILLPCVRIARNGAKTDIIQCQILM